MTKLLLGIAEYWVSYIFSVKIQIMYRMASVRKATVPHGKCPEWQVSRMATVPNGKSRMASVSNGNCPNGKRVPAL